MGGKATANVKRSHGWRDLIGIALLAIAVLLFFAFWSYNPSDLAINRIPSNEEPENWIGSIGARMAYAGFFCLGLSAYLLPVFLLALALSCFIDAFAYFRHRWIAIILSIVASAGILDLYDHLFREALHEELTAPTAGGLLGELVNQAVFENFGTVGASILFGVIYLFAFVAFTDYQLRHWVRAWWERRKAAREAKANDEEALAKRAKRLKKEARKLQQEFKKAGLGSEMEQVPNPTVRDNPQPTAPSAKSSKKADKEATATPASSTAESGREVPAATKDSILGGGNSSKSSKQEAKGSKNDKTPVVTDASGPLSKSGSGRTKAAAVSSGPKFGDYHFPTLDFLGHADSPGESTETKEALMANARLMQNTLAQFGIEVSLGDITKGPTITRFELHPAPGVKMEKISNLSNNIAAALKAERINILAPIPGKGSVGIEVPNKVKTKVVMRELMESQEWQQTKAKIPLALGKDVYGNPIIGDLTEMPHLLIAGSTGSGKSVCINSIIASLLYQFSPDDLRFVMIDPKVVELQQYNSLPHLVVPVVNEPKKVVTALRWVCNEMEKRYQIFAKAGVRNIQAFNRRPQKPPKKSASAPSQGTETDPNAEGCAVEVDQEITVPRDDDIEVPEKLSYIVVIIDELADLMLVAPSDVEMAIARITQMARAAGIHCIVATQRPSVNVITGVIKANIPARIAFQVAAKVDSRTILDAMGADKLLGKGDMLYLPPGSAGLVRVQGVLVTDEEIQSIVDAISNQIAPSYEKEIHEQLQKPVGTLESENESSEDEELLQKCIEVIRSEQRASVSLIQRRLRLGYTRAARIMDELEGRGVVGPSRGAEPREILMDSGAG